MNALTIDREGWTAAGDALLHDAIELRRAIHMEPELGLHLPKTTEKVLKAL
jgi:hippurate hydrolase